MLYYVTLTVLGGRFYYVGGEGIGPVPDMTVTTYYEYENTVTFIYTLGTSGLPDAPKNWRLKV